MKKVLVISHSQSGQLAQFVELATAPLRQSDEVKIDYHCVEPVNKYPYPWSFYPFFDAFPEAIYMNGCDVKPAENLEEEYDLIILGYTVWFLSPSIPMTGFLQTEQAQSLINGKPVITFIACRDMWVMAQEKMKTVIAELGGTLIDNAVLTDQGGSVYAFITTPRWLLTGKKDPFWIFPAAGVSEKDLQESERFGHRLVSALKNDLEKKKEPLLKNLNAVTVNGKLIGSEKIATRSFMVWGKLIQKSGKPGSFPRKIVITIYAVFLALMVLTLVPINLLVKKLISPFRKKAVEESITYYEKPSGR
ncbi:dialkylresorcinol condensing enzyme [Aliivibrio sp. S4TY2]|uniref:dialkylrecorsinol condensing enzyme n=1 Tax=unclassified Aliivibrio TaxID=2645654 RepID=UPI0023794F6C|nr:MULTISPECIES: dialkylrecorsinol condensing enzyme [unclassified Aliivibrio]MDD9154644.1 dialkylresorcinol condensing enzyme [Aliivibrio sp. S4TY2]MDD9158993.1 dialkylresorcinol condensing enzyme [Aliivibrio sp. S4TY1]MDD9162647.1 dialkylresorcinol condensing enzyme [Aliivibrio sp. S4MY2]MDD9166992.1 dialkylresorcinol condensing enzyme [Aliivibrio sp. S4MY4]MDD9183724.1 dialkylresorcinol condensing enzyme [Aliivibrio sp. S4MY3]